MKKAILFILLLILIEVFVFPQFTVREKVEVQIIYSDIPPQKPLSLDLISAEDERDSSYTYSISGSQDSYTFYDVRPGKYYLGLDISEKMILVDVLVGFDIDENGNVTTSYSVANEIEVHESRNLKILLKFEKGEFSSGFQKNKELKFKEFDFIEMTFYFASKAPIIDEINGSSSYALSDNSDNHFPKSIETLQYKMKTGKTLKWPNYKLSEKSYMPYFEDCMHCRNGGMEGPDTYSGVNCDYMSIPELKVYYVLNSFMNIPYDSSEAKKFGMGPKRAGANRYTVAVERNSLKCIALLCQDCKCKFECTPSLYVLTDIRFFKCDDLRQLGDKLEIPYIDENNQMKTGIYDYSSGNDADCACNSFEKAIIEHELLHCAQYAKEVKEFFEGDVADNILQKVCKGTKKYKCKDDISKCNSKLEEVKKEFCKTISKYFTDALKDQANKRESEAFDYFFQIFNYVFNSCKSS